MIKGGGIVLKTTADINIPLLSTDWRRVSRL